MSEILERHASFGGTQTVYRHTSASTGTPMEFSVFVPPGAQVGATPVLIYLSGLTCSWRNVTEKGGFQGPAAQHGVIVVCPDTSPRGAEIEGEDDAYDFGTGAGFYVDATQEPWARAYRMYSYVVDELPTVVATRVPEAATTPMGVFGHSMGGHGALVTAFRNPELFRSVSAFAPICAPSRIAWGQKAFDGYLGQDRELWTRYDAAALAGTTDWDRPVLVDQGLADDFLETQLRPDLLEEACGAAGIPLTVRRHEGYDHSYYFISSFMADHIAHHARALKA